MNAPAERNEIERVKALGALGFELRMMAHAFSLLKSTQGVDDVPMERNAYIDSAYLHARVLIDFFLRPGRSSDIRRTDFVAQWAPGPTQEVKRLEDNYQFLNKYLAHLTWQRVCSDAPVWNYPDMATDVIDIADAWADHLVSNDLRLGEIFRTHVSVARLVLNGRAFGDAFQSDSGSSD